MVNLLPALFLILTTLVLLGLRWVRPNFSYYWLVSLIGVVTAWITLIALRFIIPPSGLAITWGPRSLFFTSLDFGWDQISWAYAFTLGGLTTAVILVDVARAASLDWFSWSSSTALAVFGLLAAISGNLFTLLLVWSSIDFVILYIKLRSPQHDNAVFDPVRGFAVRIFGTGLIVVAAVIDQVLTEGQLSDANLLLLHLSLYLAYGLRLGLLFVREPALPSRGLGVMVSLVPVAAANMLLHRTNLFPMPPTSLPIFFAMMAILAVYAAFAWLSSEDEWGGHRYWILGMASLILVSTVRGVSGATLAWGISLILFGGLLFLYSVRERWTVVFPIFGLWGISSLPFSTTWDGASLYADPFHPLLAFFVLCQAGLLAGYLRHAARFEEYIETSERWVRVIYPLGLGLLPLISLFIILWPWKGADWLTANPWWPGLSSVILGALIWWGFQTGASLESLDTLLKRVRSLVAYVTQAIWRGFLIPLRVASYITTMLEGEGGLLWALLILTLLISLISQISPEALANGN